MGLERRYVTQHCYRVSSCNVVGQGGFPQTIGSKEWAKCMVNVFPPTSLSTLPAGLVLAAFCLRLHLQVIKCRGHGAASRSSRHEAAAFECPYLAFSDQGLKLPRQWCETALVPGYCSNIVDLCKVGELLSLADVGLQGPFHENILPCLDRRSDRCRMAVHTNARDYQIDVGILCKIWEALSASRTSWERNPVYPRPIHMPEPASNSSHRHG
jgi:hypothetical protein